MHSIEMLCSLWVFCIATGYKFNGGDPISGKAIIVLSSIAVLPRLISYPIQLSRLIGTGIKRPERKAYLSSPSNAQGEVISMQHVGELRGTERWIEFVFIQTYPFKILLCCQSDSQLLVATKLSVSFPFGANVSPSPRDSICVGINHFTSMLRSDFSDLPRTINSTQIDESFRHLKNIPAQWKPPIFFRILSVLRVPVSEFECSVRRSEEMSKLAVIF
jgi:hypothetical protein